MMKIEQRAGTVTIVTDKARILIADTQDGRVRIKTLEGNTVGRTTGKTFTSATGVTIAELDSEIWVQ